MLSSSLAPLHPVIWDNSNTPSVRYQYLKNEILRLLSIFSGEINQRDALRALNLLHKYRLPARAVDSCGRHQLVSESGTLTVGPPLTPQWLLLNIRRLLFIP